MLAIQKLVRGVHTVVVGVLLLALLAGCGEPGPRALLKGEQHLKERNFDKALEQIQKALEYLPGEARAWNLLGLAYHGLNQPKEAYDAYYEALRLDHKLASARYNMGCLYLDYDDPTNAVQQLTSYTMLQSTSIDGFLKLGSAQLQTGDYQGAQKTFGSVLELQPQNAQALNGMGVAKAHLNRYLDAMSYFSQAQDADPKFGAPILNSAILTHKQIKNPERALEKYRKYLNLSSRAPNWETVGLIARGLERQLNPVPTTPKTNATLVARADTPNDYTTVVPPRPKTNSVPRTTNTVPPHVNIQTQKVTTVVRPPQTNTPTRRRTEPVPPPINVDTTSPTQVQTQAVVKVTPPKATNTTSVSAVTVNPDPLLATTPKDLATPRPLTTNSVTRPDVTPLNPNKIRPRTNQVARLDTSRVQPNVSTPKVASNIPRYRYRRPQVLPAGEREAAEVEMRQGLKQHTAGQYSKAIEHYQQSAALDPSYFLAYYNQGLAAYQMANWSVSLESYEMALALDPNNANAHYNFCLALQKANYPWDAVLELQKMLQNHPRDARAHLTLANLYANQFKQPKKARPHYLKVLEINPRHPQASRIRYWIAANR